MAKFTVNHALIYRVGISMIFLFFMGLMVAVFMVAQSRKSGSTGIDADKMSDIRAAATRIENLE